MRTKIIITIVGCIIVVGFILQSITNVKNSNCQSKFGPGGNKRRQQLGIPIIPAGWQTFNSYKNATTWLPEKAQKGHGFKIVVYCGCELDAEEDCYYFDLKNIHDSVLAVDYKYACSKRHKDSTVFIYQLASRTDTITRKQADSILAANKINKD